jgi:AcrR family transcriptional regulator
MTHKKRLKVDLRVRRTRGLIVEAFRKLTIERGFASVTVRDIATEAGVNRATFYRHYEDKFDLLEQYTREVYELLNDVAQSTAAGPDGEAAEGGSSGLSRMLGHLRANAKFYRVMLGKNGDPRFAENIRKYVRKRLRYSLPQGQVGDENLLNLFFAYSSSASLGAVLWWLEHGMPYSADELATISRKLTSAGFDAIGELQRTLRRP